MNVWEAQPWLKGPERAALGLHPKRWLSVKTEVAVWFDKDDRLWGTSLSIAFDFEKAFIRAMKISQKK